MTNESLNQNTNSEKDEIKNTTNHQGVGRRILGSFPTSEQQEIETTQPENTINLVKDAWYKYDNDVDLYSLAEHSITPKLNLLGPKSREDQNIFFTNLAKEDTNTEISFIHDIMHTDDALYYTDYSYDEESGENILYYNFVDYLSNPKNWEREQEYKQFLDWYQEKLIEKKSELLEQAKNCERVFQEALEKRIAEGILPKEYLGGLNYLKDNAIQYQLCDMIDGHMDFLDGKGAFAAQASTAHRRLHLNTQPLITYNLANNYPSAKIQSVFNHEFLHIVGGNYGLVTYQEAINEASTVHEEEVIAREHGEANTIFEEGMVEVIRHILETGKAEITTNGAYNTEQQVIQYLCEESSGNITINDLLLAHADKSSNRQAQNKLTQKISDSFPWWKGKRGVLEFLIERHIWFNRVNNYSE